MPSRKRNSKSSTASKKGSVIFRGLLNRELVKSQPKSSLHSAFVSLPLEIHHMILTACIKPTWTQPEEGTEEYDCQSQAPWKWYLSHAIPRPLFQVSKSMRGEALQALAIYPGLVLICNVWPDGETEGWCTQPDAYPEPSRPTRGTMRMSRECEEVHKKYEKLNPRSRNLRVCLYADDDHGIVDDLEACRRSLVRTVFEIVEYFPVWDRVDLDLDGTNQAMITLNDLGPLFGVGHPLGPHLDRGWEKIVEELKCIRDRCKGFAVGLRGWHQDPIILKLEKTAPQ